MVVRKLFEIDEEKGWGRVARCIKEAPPSPFYCFPFCHTRPILHPFLETLRWQFENGAVIYDELIRREFVARRLDRAKERGMIPIYRFIFIELEPIFFYIFIYSRFIQPR